MYTIDDIVFPEITTVAVKNVHRDFKYLLHIFDILNKNILKLEKNLSII